MAAEKKGLSPLAWIAIGVGTLFVLGILAIGAVTWFVAGKVKEFAENPAKLVELAVMANPNIDLVDTDDVSGTFTIKDVRTGETATFDYSQIKEGKFSIITKDGKLALEATGEDGGHMTITGKDGEEVFRAEGDASEGRLTMKSEEGTSTFEATKDAQGGTWTAKSDKGEFRMGSGENAEEMPDWIEPYPGSGDPVNTITTSTDKENGGSVTFQTSDPVAKVLEFYEGRLKAGGFEVQKNTYSGAQGDGGSIFANTDGEKRRVYVLVSRQKDMTQYVLNYNEKVGGE